MRWGRFLCCTGIQHSLKNHKGKGVQIVGEARPGAAEIERGRTF
jgi:hypothetical protein